MAKQKLEINNKSDGKESQGIERRQTERFRLLIKTSTIVATKYGTLLIYTAVDGQNYAATKEDIASMLMAFAKGDISWTIPAWSYKNKP